MAWFMLCLLCWAWPLQLCSCGLSLGSGNSWPWALLCKCHTFLESLIPWCRGWNLGFKLIMPSFRELTLSDVPLTHSLLKPWARAFITHTLRSCRPTKSAQCGWRFQVLLLLVAPSASSYQSSRGHEHGGSWTWIKNLLGSCTWVGSLSVAFSARAPFQQICPAAFDGPLPLEHSVVSLGSPAKSGNLFDIVALLSEPVLLETLNLFKVL